MASYSSILAWRIPMDRGAWKAKVHGVTKSQTWQRLRHNSTTQTCTDLKVGPQKKAEHQRIDAFELWCWRRLLRVPWTARRSNQPILKKINLEYSLVGLMLKLKLQYFGHLMQSADSLEKTLMLGKTEGRRIWGQQRMRWLDDITDSMDMSFEQTLGDSGGPGSLACCSS